MAKDKAGEKRQRRAAKGARRVERFADELRAKLDRYRLDDRSSILIDRVLQDLEELGRYEQALADRLASDTASPPPAT